MVRDEDSSSRNGKPERVGLRAFDPKRAALWNKRLAWSIHNVVIPCLDLRTITFTQITIVSNDDDRGRSDFLSTRMFLRRRSHRVRHTESDSAVVQTDHKTRLNSEVEELKEELKEEHSQ